MNALKTKYALVFLFVSSVFWFERFVLAQSTAYPSPKTRFYLSKISAPYFTLNKPISSSLFGTPRTITASRSELRSYVHPRVLLGKSDWNELVKNAADPTYFRKPGTWSNILYGITARHGPTSAFLDHLADLETSGATAVFTGESPSDFSSVESYNGYRESLKPLTENILRSAERESHHHIICAFWADVYESRPDSDPSDTSASDRCIAATVAWAKVLLAHRTYHCNPTCNASNGGTERSHIWRFQSTWAVSNDWITCGASLALTYDVFYDKFTKEQQEVIRSALALLVMNRFSWGNKLSTGPSDDYYSPNAEKYPHRMFSNWAMYHSNLYLTNLAIEGESGFIPYAANVLKEHISKGFNDGLNARYSAAIDAYFTHSIYPDGMTFEDGYTWHTALREGSLGFIARHRRGGKIIDTPRFRNAIHACAQMREPWYCGEIVGHSGGGGLSYPSHVALFRYTYPQGVLPQMLWAQRMGPTFDNSKCRINFEQTMIQLIFLGGEHWDGAIAQAPEYMPASARAQFPLTFVGTRRGLIIMRGSHTERTAYMHFDARPDSFFTGHDNADRGSITFSSLKQRWLDDHLWSKNLDSRRHSLMHVDGLAQDVKAPSVTILRVDDSSDLSIAVADLSYTYNVQWAKAWQSSSRGFGPVTEYDDQGVARVRQVSFPDAEENSPWDLGWPMEDDGKDIGFFQSMTLLGVSEIGFRGINEWRRPYRSQYLSHMVRSTIMIRSNKNDVGVALVADSVAFTSGSHVFESYLVLHDKVVVNTESSACTANECFIMLTASAQQHLDVQIIANGEISYRVETFAESGTGKAHKRIVVRSEGRSSEEFWMSLYAHEGDRSKFKMAQNSAEVLAVTYEGDDWAFAIDKADHGAIKVAVPSERIMSDGKQMRAENEKEQIEEVGNSSLSSTIASYKS